MRTLHSHNDSKQARTKQNGTHEIVPQATQILIAEGEETPTKIYKIFATLHGNTETEAETLRSLLNYLSQPKNNHKLTRYEALASEIANTDGASQGDIDAFIFETSQLRTSGIETIAAHYSMVFALLFYRWICRPGVHVRTLGRVWEPWVLGCNRLLWIDLENQTQRFAPIYRYFSETIIANIENFDGTHIMTNALDVVNIVMKFYFYYNHNVQKEVLMLWLDAMAHKLPKYSDQIRLPKDHGKIVPINMFVNEVYRMLQKMTNETAILSYLCHLRVFKGTQLGRKTSLRISTLLLDMSTPGAPLYPTRVIRNAALQTQDILFPQGYYSRRLVNYSFRLFSPINAFRSFWFRVIILFSIIWTNLCCCCQRPKNKAKLR